MQNNTTKPDCFIIMPISDPPGYAPGHFRRVYEDILRVSCEKAGYNAIRADDVKQTNLIHIDILLKVINSPMAICDLSNTNPNVLFELGIRQAFDKPTVLIQEVGTPKIFDISPLRYYEYRKELLYREVKEDQEYISQALKATEEAAHDSNNINSFISLLSLSNPATLREVKDDNTVKMFRILMSEMNDLRNDVKRDLSKATTTNKQQSLGEDKQDNYDPEYDILVQLYNSFLESFKKGLPSDSIILQGETLERECTYYLRTWKPTPEKLNGIRNMTIDIRKILSSISDMDLNKSNA